MAVASERGAGVAAALLVDGNAAAALLESVRERDADVLVMMDARHDRSVAERLLDTVAMEVTKRATCDALILRPPPPGEIAVPQDA